MVPDVSNVSNDRQNFMDVRVFAAPAVDPLLLQSQRLLGYVRKRLRVPPWVEFLFTL